MEWRGVSEVEWSGVERRGVEWSGFNVKIVELD